MKTSPWIQTYTGKAFDLFDPQPDQVDLVDIAHHLAQLCRFTGATRRFYSVAEHSCIMSDLIGTDDPAVKLGALLHDAHEAYLGDFASPLGREVFLRIDSDLVTLTALKAKIQSVIHEALGVSLTTVTRPLIHETDLKMLATEKRDLLLHEPRPWIDLPEPFAESLTTEVMPSWGPSHPRLNLVISWPLFFRIRFHQLMVDYHSAALVDRLTTP